MTPIKWLVAALALLGLVALAGAITYFTVPAHSLPSFLGTLHPGKAHRTHRGAAALVIAIVLWVVAVVIYVADARSARRVGTGGAAPPA
jgi:hypothetical protein